MHQKHIKIKNRQFLVEFLLISLGGGGDFINPLAEVGGRLRLRARYCGITELIFYSITAHRSFQNTADRKHGHLHFLRYFLQNFIRHLKAFKKAF